MNSRGVSLRQPTLVTSCMNSVLQSTQEFWYRKLGIDLAMHGPWRF